MAAGGGGTGPRGPPGAEPPPAPFSTRRRAGTGRVNHRAWPEVAAAFRPEIMHGGNGMRIRGSSLLTARKIPMRYYRKPPVYPPAPPRRLRCRQELTAAGNL